MTVQDLMQNILVQANEKCRAFKGYRYGQAIYDSLPAEVSEFVNGKKFDMFNELDPQVATTKLQAAMEAYSEHAAQGKENE